MYQISLNLDRMAANYHLYNYRLWHIILNNNFGQLTKEIERCVEGKRLYAAY